MKNLKTFDSLNENIREKNMDAVFTKITRYAYDPIEWDYTKLTQKEKALLSPDEFNALRAKYAPKKYQKK